MATNARPVQHSICSWRSVARSLRKLDLDFFSDEGSIEELIVALKKLPLLEDLQLLLTFIIDYIDGEHSLLQSICQTCPSLKNLVVIYGSAIELEDDEEDFYKQPTDGEITMMPSLRSLGLYDCDLSFKGPNDILDNCPLLESLVIDGYFNKREMDKDLRVKLACVKKLSLLTDVDLKNYVSSEDYYDCFEQCNVMMIILKMSHKGEQLF